MIHSCNTASLTTMQDDDIAIIGMACRLPGENNSTNDLWDSVLNKRVASGEIPASRWQYYRGRDTETDKVARS